MHAPLVVNYGAGTNSTALLVGLSQRGIRPDAIVFADTGGERPGTYAYLSIMDAWLESVGFPPITVVRWIRKMGPHAGKFISLEVAALERAELPSIAYGFKGCSTKWKIQVVEGWIKTWALVHEAWAAGIPCRRTLGIDAGEPHRAKDNPDPRWQFSYPLIEWRWFREDCVAAIEAVGLPLPGKSACFFCPSSTPAEVHALGIAHPELLTRALAIEDAWREKGARETTIQGLGRNFAWRAVAEGRVTYRNSRLPVLPGYTTTEGTEYVLGARERQRACVCVDDSED